MKPPRVYIRSNHYYIGYYVSKQRKEVVVSTGIFADRKDWKRSESRDALEAIIEGLELDRAAKTKGTYYTTLAKRVKRTPEDLLTEYIKRAKHEQQALESGTVDRKVSAIKLFRKFHAFEHIRQIDSEIAGEFKVWAGERIKDSTLQGYITDLKSLFGLAAERKYITSNPFERITVTVDIVPKIRTRYEIEYKLFDFLYSQNRPLFEQALEERLTGWRVQDICNLSPDVIQDWYFKVVNTKGKRIELFPISEANRWLLERLPAPRVWKGGTYLFHFRNRSTVNYQLGLACGFVGIPKINTHKLKSNYVSEFRKQTGDPDLIPYLSHHRFRGQTRTSAIHYVDPEVLLEEGKSVLDRAQKHWLDFFQTLKEEPRRNYVWSNPKGFKKRTAK